MDDTPTTLLVAESDDELREFLVDQFTADQFAARGAASVEEARVKLAHVHPDVLLLGELEQPRAHVALLRRIRTGGLEGLPVLVVSADGSELAQLRAFREGADDYVAKPVSYPLLHARAGALVRRARGGLVPCLRVGALEIDPLARRAVLADRPLYLSRLEFDLLAYLASEPTRVFGKWELLRDVWGYKSPGRTRSVDAHACRLRRKLALAGAPDLVANVRGVGYRLSLMPVVAHDEHELAGAALTWNGRAA